MRIAIFSPDRTIATRIERDLSPLARARPKLFDSSSKLLAWAEAEKPAVIVVALEAGAGPLHLETVQSLRGRLGGNCPSILCILNGDTETTPAAAITAGAREVCRRDAHPAELRNRISVLMELAEAQGALWQERDNRTTHSISDGLTGLINRRAFLTRLDTEIARAKRGREPLVTALLDVDRLKDINAKHGNAVGDRVLSAVAEQTGHILREMDIAGRLGGTEFALCLPKTTVSEGTTVLNRLRRRLADIAFPLPRGSLSITVSIGVTAMDDDDRDSSDLINRADRALLKAKDLGRDRVERA